MICFQKEENILYGELLIMFASNAVRKFAWCHRGINLRPLFLQVNAGAILIMSLLQRHIHPEMSMANKFDYLLNYYSRSGLD
jgi:hypothetical protein